MLHFLITTMQDFLIFIGAVVWAGLLVVIVWLHSDGDRKINIQFHDPNATEVINQKASTVAT